MRALIADGLLAVTGRVMRWVDPSVYDVHVLRTSTPFGAHLPLPDVRDPCVPTSTCYIEWI